MAKISSQSDLYIGRYSILKLGGISVITDDCSYVILNFFKHKGSFVLFAPVN